MAPEKGKRKSLSDSDEGIELLLLLKEITADGKISNDEIVALREWASHVQESDVLQVRKLSGVITHVCEDGVITTDERQFVFKTIESVLPPEDRAIARFRRQQAVKDEKSLKKEMQRRADEEAREKELANEPVEEFETFVAGTRYENRNEYIATRLTPSTPVFLIRERENRYSANAVAVVDDKGVCIGYVSEDDSPEVAALLDSKHPYKCKIKKLWTARDGNLVPILRFAFYGHGCDIPGLIKADFKPVAAQRMQTATTRSAQGSDQQGGVPLGVIVVGVCVVVVVLAIIAAKAIA
jgi:hypothetical protein